jgi:RNA polymerase sigma-70 factor (ECF subfamily)
MARAAVKDDAHLVEASRNGDRDAFGELVLRYQDRLYHTVVHVVGSAEDALDVVQESFVQAYLKLESFRGNSAFYTWLYRIAMNRAISRRRRAKPTLSVEQTREVSGSEPIDQGDAPEARLMRAEQADQVHEALAALSEEHRTILVLREMEGCCYDSIAEILELPVGTVRSRLHRARLQLKAELERLLGEADATPNPRGAKHPR